jgi:N-acetylmuramoyl-L-alanine amidase
MKKKICIDPGHNGYGFDTGAEGFGLREQDLTLDISKRIEVGLKRNNFEVLLTRNGEVVPGQINSVTDSLRARCDIANNFKADLFITIHINSAGGTGVEIFIIEHNGEAEVLAEKVLPHLSALGFTNRGIKQKNLYVLKYTEMPAILTENGFIDNQADILKLKDPAFRQRIADAHVRGICDYYDQDYKGVEESVLKIAILKFSPEDEWSAKDIDEKFGGVANFTRQGINKIIPPDAMSAEQLIVIGGLKVGHKNEILLSGKDKYDTAAKVADYLRQ